MKKARAPIGEARDDYTIFQAIAQRMGANDPVAGMRLHGPAPRIDRLDERDDAGRPDADDARDRTELGRGELGEARPAGRRVFILEKCEIRSSQLDHQAVDLPVHRGGVVFQADDKDPVARRHVQRLADDPGGQRTEQIESDRSRSGSVQRVEGATE